MALAGQHRAVKWCLSGLGLYLDTLQRMDEFMYEHSIASAAILCCTIAALVVLAISQDPDR